MKFNVLLLFTLAILYYNCVQSAPIPKPKKPINIVDLLPGEYYYCKWARWEGKIVFGSLIDPINCGYFYIDSTWDREVCNNNIAPDIYKELCIYEGYYYINKVNNEVRIKHKDYPEYGFIPIILNGKISVKDFELHKVGK